MSDLGNLDQFLKEASVPNLDWLDVNEAEYRKNDRLPKQNLDIVPDLEAQWRHEDKPASRYVPNRAGVPRTMGDMSSEHGFLRSRPDDIVRVARLLLMQSTDPARWQSGLLAKFDRQSLQAARPVLAEVLKERGLLGPVYIQAQDFPDCTGNNLKARDFVRRYASNALFVVAKPQCQGCVYASGSACGVFHKQIQVEVPYSDALADQVERQQQAKGYQITAASTDPKVRIRLAMLAPKQDRSGTSPIHPTEDSTRLLRVGGEPAQVDLGVNTGPAQASALYAVAEAVVQGRLTTAAAHALNLRIRSAETLSVLDQIRTEAESSVQAPGVVYRGQGQQDPGPGMTPQQAQEGLIQASRLMAKRDAEQARQVVQASARPVLERVRRELLKGRTASEVLSVLSQSFDPGRIASTQQDWEPLLREAGSYGTVYTTQDSFENCHEGAGFVAKYNPGIGSVVAGSKCSDCAYNRLGSCLVYGKTLVGSPDELLTQETVDQVWQEHVAAGRIPPWNHALKIAGTPQKALAGIHAAAARKPGTTIHAGPRPVVETQHAGYSTQHVTRADIQDQVVTATRRYLNEGLYGPEIGRLLRSRFDPRDIQASVHQIREAGREQGLQGIYFVDPTVYSDYGKGCDEAARIHRTRPVPYLKAGSKCSTCVLQTRQGFCSKINKPVVDPIPYPGNPQEIQRQILASGPSTHTDPTTLINDGRSVMLEYEMGRRASDIDLAPEVQPVQLAIELGNQKVSL